MTVVVATFGERRWCDVAQRAISSAESQAPVIHVHGDTLHEARNAGAEQATSEWLVFLDADDELEEGYIDAMDNSNVDLRAPLIRFVRGRHPGAAEQPLGSNDLREGNRLAIGTAIRRHMFHDVGGFRNWAFYEDWDLWLRCYLNGATWAFTDAVYRAHVVPGSRNRAPKRHEKIAMRQAILTDLELSA